MTPGTLRQVMPTFLLKKLMVIIKHLMVNFQMRSSGFYLWLILTSSPLSLLDANLRLGPIPDATSDQEVGQGTYQATGEEEHGDTLNPKSIEGTINIPFILAQIS